MMPTHHERRLARKAREEAGEIRVSWRKVSDDTGGGYSGYGPGSPATLVYVRWSGPFNRSGEWAFGIRRAPDYQDEPRGTRVLLLEAKAAAAELFREEAT